MTGTFGGALEARDIPASEGFLYSDTVGEIERENNVLVIKRIHITYHLKVDSDLLADKRDAIDRVMHIHAAACPVHKSIAGCIEITTDLDIEAV